MCGIAVQYGAIDETEGARMLARIQHRGPDDRGSLTLDDTTWLGHRRLSIVDVEGGHQPLRTPDGEWALVGNGEIYNHEKLRAELLRGDLLTRSDNEVALRLYVEQGPAAFAQLHGMWALAIADRHGHLVVARDPVGIKPLYWAERDGVVRFASEMRAFDDHWRPYIESFPPGHYWTPAGGLQRFATPVPEVPSTTWAEPASEDEEPPAAILTAIRERLVAAVERQLMGDVPVGVFLSGGLDSTLVAAIAARALRRKGEQLQTFSVGLSDAPDLLAAREAADFLGTRHRERIYTAQEARAIVPEVVATIESYDPSLVRSAVANHLLAEMTAEHVKVVLTGEGADEIFAGYDYYHALDGGAEGLHDELVRTIEGLHDLNLQRCDRVTMAHGLEARVPFLELDLIDLGLALPAGWKTTREGWPEKRLLREAFTGWLPDHLLWRRKAQFGDGSGMASVLQEHLAATVSDRDWETDRPVVVPPLRSREEMATYRIFADRLQGVRPEATIGRFATL